MGQRREPVWTRRDPGHRCPLRARPAPRGAECLQGSAGGRPPTPARVALAGAGHNGPAGRADGPGPGCRKGKGNRERAEGEGGPEVPQVPPRPGPGARLQRRNAASPPQTQQRREGIPAEPGAAGWGERRRWQVRSSERLGDAIMGEGGSPFRPTRGRAASPPRPAPGPDDRGRPAGPRPSHLRQRRRWKVQGADRRAGTRQRGKLGSGMFRFTGLATRPSARAQEWPDERGPAAPVRPARRCARRVPPRASARAEPLGLSFLLPPALSLPEPGLIWSCWRQGVGAAQPPLLRCQYPAHSPARPLVCSHAHPRAAAAAARPGILSKFPAPPARARRWEARGPRGERPQPPAPLIPAGKTTRILASPCLLSSG